MPTPVSLSPGVHMRTRPLSAGHLRALEAVARHLNFRAAADELALTQSAVSRQIQSLEDEVGVALFLRHTRAVELTSAGAQLVRAVVPSLERIDAAVRLIPRTAGRTSVAILNKWAAVPYVCLASSSHRWPALGCSKAGSRCAEGKTWRSLRWWRPVTRTAPKIWNG